MLFSSLIIKDYNANIAYRNMLTRLKNGLSYITLVIFLLFFSIHATAQDTAQHGIIVHADPRLSILLKKDHTTAPIFQPEPLTDRTIKQAPRETAMAGPIHHEIRTLYKGKGYRVQIYYGPDRAKAIEIKTDFMRRFPGVHSYLAYIAPSFRVKVGDYRDRGDAIGMLKEANSIYSPSMIVPDIVTVSNY